MRDPIIIGGNGHSGTRIFATILMHNGVFMGLPLITRTRRSKDLFMFDLMNRWKSPYLKQELCRDDYEKMKIAFRRRLRIFFPFRSKPWGFKNPRSMFFLPLYFDLFPRMKFIHVVRDGRDMCFGNEFGRGGGDSAFLSQKEKKMNLMPEESMILFWGKSNLRTREYGMENLKDNYLLTRFEDMCNNPKKEIEKILKFCDCHLQNLDFSASLVRKPMSIGRWKGFDFNTAQKVQLLGKEYLQAFGYK